MSEPRPQIEPLPEGIAAAVADATAHPGDPSATAGVEWRQTHISHVFLTTDRVVKLRKAVSLSFLSFATRAERNRDCLREVSLNRRLAPDVYLGVAPLLPRDGSFAVGEIGEQIRDDTREHVVVMRRLPDGCDALSLLEADALAPAHIDAAADVLARFHEDVGLGAPAPFGARYWRERILAPIQDSARSLSAQSPPFPDSSALASYQERVRERWNSLEHAMEQRRVAGRAVDAHGDLHLDHLWFERDAEHPVFIDCLEFDEDLRHIDEASEVAFLAMDLAYRGRSDLGERFLRRYAEQRDDFGLYTVADFFMSYRAIVRAKVAALAAGDASIPPEQRAAAESSTRAHFELAVQALDTRDDASVVIVCGSVGAGKSSVAERLADSRSAVVVSSDRTRKAMAGLPATERGAETLYHPSEVERVYGALLERAAAVVGSGRPVVLDATYGLRRRRDPVRQWAEAHGLQASLIEVRCSPKVALERLARRSARADDPSDAGPELLETSLRAFEPPDEWPHRDHYEIDTTTPHWRDQLGKIVEQLPAHGQARRET